jgi:hypothetical protein
MEHQPLMTTNVGYTVVVLAILYAGALIGVLPKRPRVAWLVPLIWFCLAWTRIRHGPLFAVTSAIALAEMLPHIRWLAWLSRHGSHTCRLRPPATPRASIAMRLRPALLPAALVLLALVLQASGTPFPLFGAGRARLNADDMPVDLLPDLQQLAHERPPGTPIFNDMFYAGFLIYYTPELRVFIDDRCELYGDEELLTYAHAVTEDPAHVDRWQKEYGFDLVLTATGSSFDRYLKESPDWVVVRQTTPATLFRRKAP